MARVSDKTVKRATALVTYEQAQVKVKNAKAKMDSAKNAVDRAKAYADWVDARMERQNAGKVLRPRRRKD